MNRNLSAATLLLSMVLVACGAEQTSATPAPTTSASVASTATATVTASPIPTATVPTTARSDWQLSDDFFFGESSVPDCQLPCWQGLVIGESDRDDIQAVFDNVFAFNGTHDFFPLAGQDMPSDALAPEGIYQSGNRWTFSTTERGLPAEGFAFIAFIDTSEYVTRALWFQSSSVAFNSQLSPQRFIQELGQPDFFRAKINGTERGDIAAIQLIMIYREGIVFEANGQGAMYIREADFIDEQNYRYTVDLCRGSVGDGRIQVCPDNGATYW